MQYVVMKARLARLGVFYYQGSGFELKTEETLKSGIDNFTVVPITIGHHGLITPHENDTLFQGYVESPEIDGDWLIGKVVLTHPESIEIASNNKAYFSCGYSIKLKPEKGQWVDVNGVQGEPGESYDYELVQYEMSINHVAIVSNPRAGLGATFIEDSTGAQNAIIESSLKNELDMEQETTPVDNRQQEFDELNNQIESLKRVIEQLTAEKDAIKESSLVKQDSFNQDSIDEVKSRVELITTHSDSLDASMAHLPSHELRKQVLLSIYPNLTDKITNGSQVYLETLYDVSRASNTNLEQSKQELKSDSADNNQDDLARFKEAQSAYINKRGYKVN